MVNEDKPCFDESLSDPQPCLEGTAEANECNRLKKGGCWRTCNNGGKSDHLAAYQEQAESVRPLALICPFLDRDCTAACALWVGGATWGNSGCAIAQLGRQARGARREV